LENNINTILFDLDDTLIMERQSADDSFIETIRLAKLQINEDDFLQVIRNQARELWYQLPTIDFCLNIGLSSWAALWADFTGDEEIFVKLRELSPDYRFETWNLTLMKFNIKQPGVAEMLSREFIRIRRSKHILFPETIDTLNQLKGRFKFGLITNGTPDLQWKKIEGGNLKKYFDCITIAGEYGFAKPDSRLFEAVISGLKSSKKNAVMVGDSLNSDIAGARNYGLKTIWVNRTGRIAEEIKPDYEINNLTELFKIIAL
jgi:putative hydrolase of the HAD superfamily